MSQNDAKFKLVTINPAFVFGPGHKKGVSESQQVILDIVEGKFPFLMDLHWATIDVRDVAYCHIRAIEIEESKGRYICSNGTSSFTEVCKIISKNFKFKKIPTLDMNCSIGSKLVYISAYFQPKGVKSYLQTNIGKKYNFDNSKK